MRRIVWLALLGACEAGAIIIEQPPVEDEGPQPIDLDEGAWEGRFDLVRPGCWVQPPWATTLAVDLAQEADDVVILDPLDSSMTAARCDRSPPELTCEPMVTVMDDLPEYRRELRWTLSGTVVDARTLDMDLEIAFVCDGIWCAPQENCSFSAAGPLRRR